MLSDKNNLDHQKNNIKLIILRDLMNKTIGLSRFYSSWTPNKKKCFQIENCIYHINMYLYDIFMSKMNKFNDSFFILFLCGCEDNIIDLLNKINEKDNIISEEDNIIREEDNIINEKDSNSTIEKLKNTCYYFYLNQKDMIKAINIKNRELIYALVLLNYQIINSQTIQILIKNNISFSFYTLDKFYGIGLHVSLLKILFHKGQNNKHKFGRGNTNIKIIIELLKKFDLNNRWHQLKILDCYPSYCFEEIIDENENIKFFIKNFKMEEINRYTIIFIKYEIKKYKKY
jgi:hypothetical protein